VSGWEDKEEEEQEKDVGNEEEEGKGCCCNSKAICSDVFLDAAAAACSGRGGDGYAMIDIAEWAGKYVKEFGEKVKLKKFLGIGNCETSSIAENETAEFDDRLRDDVAWFRERFARSSSRCSKRG
jgi:hypothetical protein